MNNTSDKNTNSTNGDFEVKVGLAEMLKGGAIMDVTNAEQAKIAEDAGACAVMALERIPSDIRRDGGVARASDPDMIQQIKETGALAAHHCESCASSREEWQWRRPARPVQSHHRYAFRRSLPE